MAIAQLVPQLRGLALLSGHGAVDEGDVEVGLQAALLLERVIHLGSFGRCARIMASRTVVMREGGTWTAK